MLHLFGHDVTRMTVFGSKVYTLSGYSRAKLKVFTLLVINRLKFMQPDISKIFMIRMVT